MVDQEMNSPPPNVIDEEEMNSPPPNVIDEEEMNSIRESIRETFFSTPKPLEESGPLVGKYYFHSPEEEEKVQSDKLLEKHIEDKMDDMVCQMQDLFFTGSYLDAMDLCEQIICIKPREFEAYNIYVLSLFQTNSRQNYHKALDLIRSWLQRVGPRQRGAPLRHAINAAFYLGDTKELEVWGEPLAKLTIHQHSDFLVKMHGAYLIAGDLENKDNVVEKIIHSCQGHEIPQGYEDIVTIQMGWIEIHLGRKEVGLKMIQEIIDRSELAKDASTKSDIAFGFALLALYHHLEASCSQQAGDLILRACDIGLSDEPNIHVLKQLIIEKKDLSEMTPNQMGPLIPLLRRIIPKSDTL